MTKIVEIEITNQDFIDINKFCELNDIKEIGGYLNLCLRKGHYLEKYGLLNQGNLPDVIDREFEKEVLIEDTSKIEELENQIYILKGKLENQKEVECGKLQDTLMELNRQLGDKNETIKELRNKVNDLENLTKTSYAFLSKKFKLKRQIMITKLLAWFIMNYGLMNIMVFSSIFKDFRDGVKRIGNLDIPLISPISEFISGFMSCPMCFSFHGGWFLSLCIFSPSHELFNTPLWASWFFDGIISSGAVWAINSYIEWYEQNRPSKQK